MREQAPLNAVNVGDRLPELVKGPLTRATLALFAGASNDHNPLHIDSDHAKQWGMPDVIAPGMLSMAYLAQMLTHWMPQARLRRWSVRFTAMTPVHATTTCSGTVMEIFEEDGELRARVKISAQIDQGVQTLDGEAVVSLS